VTILVGEHGIREVEPPLVAPKVALPGKGHQGHRCVSEIIEAVAHGDSVGLARQSGQVAVEDHHDVSPAMLGKAPPVPIVVGQVDLGCRLADGRGHARR
jgi:hypothetical protein